MSELYGSRRLQSASNEPATGANGVPTWRRLRGSPTGIWSATASAPSAKLVLAERRVARMARISVRSRSLRRSVAGRVLATDAHAATRGTLVPRSRAFDAMDVRRDQRELQMSVFADNAETATRSLVLQPHAEGEEVQLQLTERRNPSERVEHRLIGGS